MPTEDYLQDEAKDMEPKKITTEEDRHAAKMQEIINRYTSFSGWYLINEKIGLGLTNLIMELSIQTAFNNAGFVVLTNILKKGRRVTSKEISKELEEYLNGRLSDMEKLHKIKILQGEVYNVDEHGNKVLDATEEGTKH